MDKYLEAEKRLAELLHPNAEFDYNIDGKLCGEWFINGKRSKKYMPSWCRDWSACGPLMVEHDCWPEDIGDGSIICGVPPIYSIIADHPDKETAVRYAVVQAVISRLSTQQEG